MRYYVRESSYGNGSWCTSYVDDDKRFMTMSTLSPDVLAWRPEGRHLQEENIERWRSRDRSDPNFRRVNKE